MTTPSTPIAPMPVQVSRPTVQYTTRAQPAFVQFQRKSPRDGTWKHEQFHPTQADFAAARTPDMQTIIDQHPELADYWSCAEAEALTLAYLRDEYGITNAVFVDPNAPPPFPEKPTVTDGVQ